MEGGIFGRVDEENLLSSIYLLESKATVGHETWVGLETIDFSDEGQALPSIVSIYHKYEHTFFKRESLTVGYVKPRASRRRIRRSTVIR